MTRYLLSRLGQLVIVFFGSTLLIYALVFLVPADPIAALGGDRTLPPEVVEGLRAQYHLDQPFLVQYWYYIKGVFTLDFGTSFSGQPVWDVMKRAFPVTVNLALIALVVEAVLGIFFGVLAGLKKGKWFDTTRRAEMRGGRATLDHRDRSAEPARRRPRRRGGGVRRA